MPTRSAPRRCCGVPPPNGGHHKWCLRDVPGALRRGAALAALTKPNPIVYDAPYVPPLARVTRIDHSPLEDRLEQANARALDAWLRSGRVL